MAECPNCGIPLTYHKVNNSLICHYCGYRRPMPEACEKWAGFHLRMCEEPSILGISNHGLLIAMKK